MNEAHGVMSRPKATSCFMLFGTLISMPIDTYISKEKNNTRFKFVESSWQDVAKSRQLRVEY
jgi:hypothetical protein